MRFWAFEVLKRLPRKLPSAPSRNFGFLENKTRALKAPNNLEVREGLSGLKGPLRDWKDRALKALHVLKGP